MSCKGEGNSSFAKAEVQVEREFAELVAEIVTTRMMAIVRGSLKLYKFHCRVVSFELHSEGSYTGQGLVDVGFLDQTV